LIIHCFSPSFPEFHRGGPLLQKCSTYKLYMIMPVFMHVFIF
jgi:hypothetical protein